MEQYRVKNEKYRVDHGHPEPTICRECGALFIHGHWTWEEIPNKVFQAICPACLRMRDDYPAGVIEISGSFFTLYRSEIMEMIKLIKDREIAERPLDRIIRTIYKPGKVIITTTGLHLARLIGDSLYEHYKGELYYNYDDVNLVKVYWNRENNVQTDH